MDLTPSLTEDSGHGPFDSQPDQIAKWGTSVEDFFARYGVTKYVKDMTTLRLLAAAALFYGAAAAAQSGRGGMSGFVQFEDVAWIEHKHAHVTLDIANPGERVHYETDTNDNGHFDVTPMMMGEYRLAISAAGFKTYETTLSVPSDFLGNIAVILKKAKHTKKKGDAP